MLSIPYFRQIAKSNFKTLGAFTLVLCVFLTVLTNVFTPATLSGVGNVVQGTVAGNILKGNSLVGFMANSFYAIMAILFPMVYSIMVANKLIAEKVDKGGMATILSTPTKRSQITISSALYLILSLIVMWVVASLVGIIAANYFQPDALDVDKFLMLNVGVVLYHLAISSICFAASCIFNTSKNSLTYGGGLPLISFIVSLLVKLSGDLDFLKYFTLTTLFDTTKILDGSGYGVNFWILGVITITLYTVGIYYFSKKDLPL